MALYGLGLGTLFFVVGAFAVNLPKAGAWMMGVKWVGGVTLAYMALAYVRDALPKETLHRGCHPGALSGVAGGVLLAAGVGPRGGARGRRAAQVEHRAPLEAHEARVGRAGNRRALHGRHVVADARRAP